MRKLFFALPLLILCIGFTKCGTVPKKAAAKKGPQAAYGVVERVCGETERFKLEYAPSNNTNLFDTFAYSAKDGVLTVKGETDLAICRGVYEYLKKHVHVMLTWAQREIKLPDALPDCEETLGGTPHEFRLYYNICAFGYTTPYWDWKRWEQEIDWMAFHGINMPLAMKGQEAVLQKVWLKHGVSQKGIDEMFCGPAYGPWQWMGNINNHNNPQPQEYIAKNAELQKQCLLRMEELGMTPVVPGFSGFVPREFAENHKDFDIHKSAGWAGFRDDQKSWWLSPKTEAFKEIAIDMVREYTNFYGPQKYFLVDSFNELAVPITGDKNEDLKEYGRKSYEALKAGIEDAVWLMQGWLFSYSRHFWTHEATEAFLSEVPNDKMIIIDLGTERYKGWEDHKAFYGKKWIQSYIHNFGGYDGMFGNCPRLMRLSFQPLKRPGRGNQVGLGYSPEGVCQNEIVYEEMTDTAWLADEMPIEDWLREFLTARYGSCPDKIWEAWQIIFKCFYSGGGGGHFKYQVIPQLSTDTHHMNPDWFKALETFLSCSNEFLNCGCYWDDAVELANHIGSTMADNMIAMTIFSHQLKAKEDAKKFLGCFTEMLSDVDKLNSTRYQFMLNEWTGAAASWSDDPELQKYYKMDARRLITVWGGHLDGYVAHHWSGLVGCYYLPRWQLYLTELLKGTDMAEIQKKVREFEQNWVNNGPDGATEPDNDPAKWTARTLKDAAQLKELFEKRNKEMVEKDRGVFLGTWNASEKHVLTNVHFLVSNNVTGPGKYQVLVKGGGYKRPCAIAIAMNGKPVAKGKALPIDTTRREEARYEINLKEHSPGASYTIEIFFKPPCNGNGAEIFLKKMGK